MEIFHNKDLTSVELSEGEGISLLIITLALIVSGAILCGKVIDRIPVQIEQENKHLEEEVPPHDQQ